MTATGDHIELLLGKAREGDIQSLNRLLGLYRNYLKLLARAKLRSPLQVRVDPSDLAQLTLLDAYRAFSQFRGHTEHELTAWLRKTLVRRLADQVKQHQSQKRDQRREESLETALQRSSQDVARLLGDKAASPSAQAVRREQSVLLADALARLPDDYREIIILRHLQRKGFSEIADSTGRSNGSLRMLWTRALERLRHEIDPPS